jgi:dTDP-4-amino-4,6-dideoxygalactose transaminase
MRRLPSAATPISNQDLFKALYNSPLELEDSLKRFLNVKNLFLTGSGTSALYIALETLKKLYPEKKTVLLPAYTAPVIKLAVDRAGLKIALCEVSKRTFNMDLKSLPPLLFKDILCVMPVHLFGIPTDICELKKVAGGLPIIEDAAQSLGSSIRGRKAGGIGDIGILSFHRGKNLSLYSGGAITTSSDDLAEGIQKSLKILIPPCLKETFSNLLKLILVSKIVNPWVYGTLYPFISPFKSRDLHLLFSLDGLTMPQIKAGGSIIKRLQELSNKRIENGIKLYHGLADIEGITLPELPEDSEVAYNQFPVVFNDVDRVEIVIERLWQQGIETSRLYLRPMHRIFDLGYPEDAFPVATWFANGLVLLPPHPLVTERDIETMVGTTKNAA